MDDDRKNAIHTLAADAILARAGTAHRNRVDGFEVAGVRDQVQRNTASIPRLKSAGRTDVVLHVAAAQNAARVNVFKPGKDVDGRFPERVHHHAQASAMAHAHNGALGAQLGPAIEQLVKEWDERGDTFERKALGAEVARLDHLLKDIGAGQQLQDVVLVDGSRCCFKPRRNPFPALAVRDVHELRTDGAGVNAAGLSNKFVFEVELGQGNRCEVLLQRIEVRLQVAPPAKSIESLLAELRRSEFHRSFEGSGGHGDVLPSFYASEMPVHHRGHREHREGISGFCWLRGAKRSCSQRETFC